jgi:hypothetical protein
MVEVFNKRDVIEKVITLGMFLLLATSTGGIHRLAPHLGTARGKPGWFQPFWQGCWQACSQALSWRCSYCFGQRQPARRISQRHPSLLLELLTFGRGTGWGVWMLPVLGAVTGLVGGAFLLLPENIRRPSLMPINGHFYGALLQPVPRHHDQPGRRHRKAAKSLFSQTGLTQNGALVFIIGTLVISIFWSSQGEKVQSSVDKLPAKGKKSLRALGILLIAYVVIMLPQAAGPFIAQVIVIISLYILMGLGLNIEIGFAGLLDLGFVAFYAMARTPSAC